MQKVKPVAMPFRSLFSSPPKKQYKQRKETQERRFNHKRFDPNLLKELGDKYHGLLETGKSPRFTKPPSLPYSKNFGSFDITWCIAKDSRRVVLVEYAGRSFINGRQIILSRDGKVLDCRGQWDVKMQHYYDRALAIKENREKDAATMEQIPLSFSKEMIEKDLNEQSLESSTLIETSRNAEMCQFDKQLNELETMFDSIMARFCNIGLVSESWATEKEGFSQVELPARMCNSLGGLGKTYENEQQKVASTLDRMVDQFKSMVELSTAFHRRPSILDDAGDASMSDTECVSITDSWSITDDFKQLGISQSILCMGQVSENTSETKYQTQSFKQNDSQSPSLVEKVDDDTHQVNDTLSTNCKKKVLSASFAEDVPSDNYSNGPSTATEQVNFRTDCIQRPDQQSLQAKNQVLQNEIVRLRTMNDELSCNNHKLTDDNLKLTGEVGKLERENGELKVCRRNSTKSKSEWNQNMKELEREIVELETKVAVTEKEKLLLSSQLKDTHSECVSAKTRLRTMERESSDQSKYTLKLESENGIHRNENERLQLNILELQSRLSSAMTENTHNLMELGNLKKGNNDKEIELLQLRTEHQKYKDSSESYLKQKCALEAEVNSLATKLDNVTEKAEHLQKHVEYLDNENGSLLNKNADVLKRFQHLETQCSDYEIELNSERKKVEILSAKTDKQEKTECKLTEENENLKISLNELSEINEQLRLKLYKFEKGSTELECKFGQLVEAKGDLQNVIKQLSHVNLNIEQRFQRMDSEYSDLECRLHNMDKLTTQYGHINWGDQHGCNVTPGQEAISPRQ